MEKLLDVPADLAVKDVIVMKRLKSGHFVEIRLAMRNGQYEAALFINDQFRPGPTLPQPMTPPTTEHTHWMGVRPSVGLTAEEAERIISEVGAENFMHKNKVKNRWDKKD